jgi:VIT1/CCC1 family predicted Fe2+/Mn2+ transporter
MKTNQIVIVAVVIITGVFFGILSMFRLPQSMMEWIISDAILGIILFLSYLMITLIRGSSMKELYPSKKTTV